MRVKIILFFVFFTIYSYSQNQNISIGFIENKGQIIDQKGKQNKNVLYLLNTPGLNVQIKKNGFSYDVYETKKHPLSKKEQKNRFTSAFSKEDTLKNPNYTLEYIYHRIDIDFVNSNKMVELVADEKSTDYDNYYNVAHAPEGITNVYKYKKITYKNIYNNIDIVFFIPEDKAKPVEYNFIVNKGGKISDIQLKFNGIKTELINNKIKMNVRFGQMEETLPLSWTEEGNSKKEVAIHYKKIQNNIYGFEGISESSKTIIIDPTPVRLWGTYYGGVSFDNLYSIETDNQENAYIYGITLSTNFIATLGSHQTNLSSINAIDGYISKFDNNGGRLWSTYYGGIEKDEINDLTINSNNKVAFCGNTYSNNNIATQGTFKSYKSGSNQNYEMFFGILDSNGLRQWASYFGDDTGHNFMNAIVFDSNNNLFIGGTTSCRNYIATPNGFQNLPPQAITQSRGFISKFTLNCNQIWGTYYGGTYETSIEDLTIDSSNNIIAAGYTYSESGISTQNSFQPLLNNSVTYVMKKDGFIVSFANSGIRNWGTYFGSSEDDYIRKIKYLNNSVYLMGNSNSIDLATPNAFLSTNTIYNSLSFIAKYDIINHQKVWFSYSYSQILDFDINQNEDIILVGNHAHYDPNISTQCSYITNGDTDGSYMRKINNNCQIIWGSYLSTFANAKNPFIKYINNNLFYVGGTYYTSTLSNGELTTPNSYQEFSNGETETYINKFEDNLTNNITVSNLNVCIGNTINFSAPISTSYQWTGPNGFSANVQNPTILNATVINNGVYSCPITGTGGCDYTITVNVLIGDTAAPIPNITNLQDINGDCNTIVTTIPTATDNCAGILNGTTTDSLNYTIPGNHVIHWSYNDGSGNSSTQNQNVVITATTLPTLNSNQNFCIQQNATLGNIVITGQNIRWYDAQTGGNLLPINTILQNGTTYYATQTNNNCESNRVPVSITIYNTPSPTANANQSFCSTANAMLNDIAISGTGVKWYDTQTGGNLLPTNTIIQNATTYYASQTLNGCESVNRTPVTINLINTLNATNFSDYLCDDLNNGHEKIDLTSYNSSLISNTTGNAFNFYKSHLGAQNQTPSEKINNENDYQLNVGTSTIYVRIDNVNTCHQIVELNLTLYSKPIIPIAEVTPICQGNTVTINAGNFDKYQWSTGESTSSIDVNQAGNYSVTVTENHIGINCTSSKDFKVVNSNAATISQVITNDWTVNENSITILVTTTSVGDYQYSLDGNNYQNSNVFTDLNSGEYNVFIRDKNGCGTISEEVFLLMYPKYFTPNGDGFNDKWKIKFSNTEPSLRIKLFDRYGKFIKELDHSSDGWNGTFNGKELPSTDYWFVVTRANGKEYRGHFAMKR